MDEPFTLLRRRVAQRHSSTLALRLASALATLFRAANLLVIAQRRSRMRYEIWAIDPAAQRRRTGDEALWK